MKLFIGNLTYETTEEELREVLADHEPILNIHRPTDRETGKPRGFAFVTFENREDGENAMEALDGVKLNGREMKVNEAEERRRFDRPEPRRVSMDVSINRAVDDRPIGPDGKRVRYKGI
ncbi:RNA-binding protein [Luteolibacter pohnpeiensis]|uniref:RNA-binding protein n=1 Tax=Luteolibacter pohnpeiensis TaxID=454153 RepID=A0A934VUR8_9BACT|nr:RNA-binding protein [Luteolibacter pohnpeiensis]MBK1881420.1 RNA-binding protein [Luteolibacter pohnpeiensis]